MPTHAIDIVTEFLRAIETDNIDGIKRHLSGDFIVHGGTAEPLNKYQFLEFLTAMKQSIPNLTVQIQSISEDYQIAQSDHVDVDVQVAGISASPRGITSPQGRLSFTIMGESIESLIIADRNVGGLIHLFEQFYAQAKEGKAAVEQKEDDHTRYNRQSNLYDPLGKSYTPAQKRLDTTPQVDAYGLSQRKQEDSPYLFSDEHEQIKYTQRQPNDTQEGQE